MIEIILSRATVIKFWHGTFKQTKYKLSFYSHLHMYSEVFLGKKNGQHGRSLLCMLGLLKLEKPLKDKVA